MLARVRALLAVLWGGYLLGLAGLAAPNAFATLERAQAALYVNRLFAIDAQLGLAIALLLVMMERRLQQDAGQPVRMSAEVLYPLFALFCIVLGFFGLQPLMLQARAGESSIPFGVLHAVSSVLFGLRALAVLLLGWRCLSRLGR